ncbi:hypothetical protein [Oceanobacillus massiliensis]|uniref:hypothetical protein n=1 Tax=Oceanobacillus massiliensis TaxID=1465765 RepID=UPI003017BC40
MRLNRSQVLQLYLKKRTKEIKNIDISRNLGISPSAVSQYFSFQMSLSDENEEKLINFIDSKPSKSDFT